MSHALADIHIASGVSQESGEGFCYVTAASPDAEIVLEGQLTPVEVRVMALQWLEAAEAAESDAAVVAELMETVGAPRDVAATFLVKLRKRRGM